MKLVPSALSLCHQQLILLAPYGSSVPTQFRNARIDPCWYGSTIVDMQKMRGRIYLEEGAITKHQLDANGRHHSPADTDSWHLLTLNEHGSVSGCVRYREHLSSVSFQELGVKNSALAECGQWGTKFRAAVESDLEVARRRKVSVVEVGGWALAKERRCTGEALRTALAMYALAQILGDCVGMATATVRNRAASILRRIGGQDLEHGGETLPPYYDPQYKCRMEILRFTARTPNPKYWRWIDQIAADLLEVPVLSLTSPVTSRVA